MGLAHAFAADCRLADAETISVHPGAGRVIVS